MRYTLTMIMVMGLAAFGVHAQDGPYRFIKEIQIGGEGGWDYLSVDSAARRLYVSHASKAVVVDIAKDVVVGEILDTPGIHGAIATTPGRVFTSNGRGNNASIVDSATLKTTAKVETQGNPDFILFEPTRKEVYTFNGTGKSATVIGAESGKVVTTIPLGGKPEAAVSDPAAGRVYVNIEDQNTLAVIDIAKHAVVATWPIAPGEEASGLAIDLKSHRLFVVSSNKLMLMMDSTNGKIVYSVPISAGGRRVVRSGTGYVFASSGDRTTTIAHEFAVEAHRDSDAQDRASARTMALIGDPRIGRPRVGEPPATGGRP